MPVEVCLVWDKTVSFSSHLSMLRDVQTSLEVFFQDNLIKIGGEDSDYSYCGLNRV